MVAIETYIYFNLNDRGQTFSRSLFLFASLLPCGGTSLVMLSIFDVSDEFALNSWSQGLIILSANGSGDLKPLSNLEKYLNFFAYHSQF